MVLLLLSDMLFVRTMSLNYAFVFSLFLLLLVAINVYFFYTLSTYKKPSVINVPEKLILVPGVFKDIHDYLNYLPIQYKNKNPKFLPYQRALVNAFNSSKVSSKSTWPSSELWSNNESLFPHENGAGGQILEAIRTSQIAVVDNAPKGTQLKLLLILEDKQKLYFKPKRYSINNVINGNIYAGFDRHNSEVLAYYLAMVMNFKWVPPSTIRRLHMHRDVVQFATAGLKRTMVKNGSGSLCIFGKCFYCRENETVCPDSKEEIEGAAILYLDKQFQIYKSPWRRSYNVRQMDWEKDNEFCKKLRGSISEKRLLNLVDVAIFDFLIQNGDRHRYEVYKDRIVLLDNGKGLGNPAVDEMDILAPLYQCCILSLSTWHHLETLSGGSLSETVQLLSRFQREVLATDEHFRAIDRRLQKVYAAVQYCIGKHGSAKVFKTL